MKFNFSKYVASLLIGIAAFASCETPTGNETAEPVFPESVVNKTVAAGESVELSIAPNLDWEVSVSGEGAGNIFWIEDEGMKTTTITGKAGSVVFTVTFSDDEEFDVNRVCDVTLAMGGQSKKIATITRPSLGRTFEIYAGVAGQTEFTEEFGTEKITSAELVTFPGVATYSLPVRVVTNYAWNISLPSWIKATSVADAATEVNSGVAGTTELLLTAQLSADILNGTEGVVKFIDANNTSAANELKITLPDFSSRVEYEINSMDFNNIGEVLMPNGSYAEGSAVAYVLAAQGMTVKALEWLGDYHDIKYAEWVNVAYGEYDEAAGPLQTIDVAISVAENTGKARYADIFIFPASMGDVNAEDICDMNDPSCGFNAEYEKYYVGRLTQGGQSAAYITPISSEDMREDVGAYFATLDAKGEDNVMQWDFPTAGSYHKITYTEEYSADEASFDCAEPFAYVKLFKDTDYPYGMFSEEVTEDEDYWISFVAFGGENMKGRFNMNFVPESPIHTAAVFYDANDNILSAVLVEYNSEATGGDDPDGLEYKITTGVGEIVRMDPETELYMALCGNFNITDVYQITTNDKMIYVQGSTEYWDVIGLDAATLGNLSGSPLSFEGASPSFYIYTGNGDARAEAIYIIQKLGPDGESMVNHAAFHVIYDPAAAIEKEAPFSFVYPDYVGQMATLKLYEGEMLQTILDEQWGLKAADVYELTYFDASASSLAVLNVPGSPQGGAAWNNYPYSADYWLQHEMDGKQMYIFMSEAGKEDYFVFYDTTGLPKCALVCTMQIANN